MSSNIYIVVGDDYNRFSSNTPNTILATDLISKLSDDSLYASNYQFIFGQGIDPQTHKTLLNILNEKNASDIVTAGEPAPLKLTHKHFNEYVMVSKPDKIGDMEYSSTFSLSNHKDRLSDHVTGQHIGGMLLMEAARQAATVAAELEFVSEEKPLGFMLERFETDFIDYAYPLPTNIIVKMFRLDDGRVISLDVVVLFTQADVEVCRVRIKSKLIDASILNAIETKKAKKAVKNQLDFHSEEVGSLQSC